MSHGQQSPIRPSAGESAMVHSSPVARHPLAPVDPALWLRDADVHRCCGCATEFGLFTRRHHCRQCGRIYCSGCSGHKWTIEGQSSRVCAGCFRRLNAAAHERLQSQQQNSYAKPMASVEEPDLMTQVANTMAIFLPDSKPAAGATTPNTSASASSSSASHPHHHHHHNHHHHHHQSHPDHQHPPMTNAMAAAQAKRESTERLIYHTGSLCPKCSLIEKRGFDQYKPAQLFEQYRGIWLRLQCALHGPHITLVCRERNFWWRCFSYQERWVAALKQSGLVDGVPATIHQGISLDIEDIGRQLRQTLMEATSASASGGSANKPPADNLPLSFELALYVDDAFVADSDLDARLVAFVQRFPADGKGSTFLLRLIGGLVEKDQIEELNTKILRLVAMASPLSPKASQHPLLTPALLNVRILVDVTYERLVDLLLLERSCFLKVRVLPCVRYFLGPGEEEQFVLEMDYLLSLVKGFSDLELVLSLSLEPPYPDTMRLLQYIKAQKGFIRFVLLSRERSPKEILGRLHDELAAARAAPPLAKQTSPNLAAYPESTDPHELLEALETGTQGLLRPSDFIPMYAAQVFEPVLQAFGYGAYHMNPSPFCGFVATLVTTDKLQSIPVTRLFDIDQLYSLLLPIAQKLKYAKEKPSIGIMIAKQIQKALKSCAYNVETPDVVSYVASGTIDRTKNATIQSFVRNLQVIIVHNRMDFASIDLHRRCRCGNVTTSPLDQTQQIATCTGCI